VLSSPAVVAPPERDVLTAALDGSLTAEKLAKLAPAAAAAAMTRGYLRQLAADSAHTLVGEFHRALAVSGADEILDSLRPNFDKHAKAIAAARDLIDPESTAEAVISAGKPALIEACQQLNEHIRAITQIAAVASQFGCRPAAQFPQVVEYAAAETFKTDDRAVICTDGELVSDSAFFGRPDAGHRTSPFFRVQLRLHTVASAQKRYDAWAATEFDRIHSGPRGGRLIDGVLVRDPIPVNPYREKVAR
jgi:hypothetical protein